LPAARHLAGARRATAALALRSTVNRKGGGNASAAGEDRLYGLDWLRIGAFALLILYHIGMFFVPWDWHVKTAEPQEWLELPMTAVNPWRLALLFVISGYASRILLAKTSERSAFARSRSVRLLVPLAAGMALFVAPQAWAELQAKAAYPHGFWHYWLNDYFVFGKTAGVITPTWNHLWFVAYLWVYTMALALLALAPATWRGRLQRGFDGLFGGWRLFVLPVVWLWLLRALVFPIFGETHALLDDLYAHLVYASAFFFGVGLAGTRSLWPPILAGWKAAAAMAAFGYGIIVLLDLTIPGDSGPLELLVTRLARSLLAWGAILALLALARLKLTRDGPARRYLTEAIFPYYIAHQTIIVLVGHALGPLRLGAAAEFAIILPSTLIGCALAFEIGRRIPWLRPLIGLKRVKPGRE
jgi:peptidoglycan/LPS O-acetylase OafA/YrhL